MSVPRSRFSERSQRAILWWGIALAVVYTLALIFLLQQGWRV
jgi:predicted tellurium resistance membrane protein TerC